MVSSRNHPIYWLQARNVTRKHIKRALHQCHKMLQDITSQQAALQLLQDNVYKDMGSLVRSKNLEKSNQDLVKLLGSKTGHCDVLVEENIKLERKIEQL